MLSNSPQR